MRISDCSSDVCSSDLSLRRLSRKQIFNPGPLGLFLNPFFLARRALWHEMARQGGTLAGPMLDVGCGTKPYRELFELEEYIELAFESPSARTQSRADYRSEARRVGN